MLKQPSSEERVGQQMLKTREVPQFNGNVLAPMKSLAASCIQGS